VIPSTDRAQPGARTGDLVMDLRNGRDWSVGDAEISVRRDTVQLRHAGRGLAILDRDLFRSQLIQFDPEPLAVDDVVWSVHIGIITFMACGNSTFRVGAGHWAPWSR
jgi:hypothetical protein